VKACQSHLTFQHLSLLRKALKKKDSGALSYISQSGHRGRINLTMGGIVAGKDTNHDLSIFFSEPVEHCDWKKYLLGGKHDSLEATIAISRAINTTQWDNTSIADLKHLFLKLPPVQVRMAPLHRYEYSDGITFLMLYQQSVQEENFLLAHFLNNASDDKVLKRRVKVLVLGYCLGLITAMPQQKNTLNNKSSTASITTRILNRIRGI